MFIYTLLSSNTLLFVSNGKNGWKNLKYEEKSNKASQGFSGFQFIDANKNSVCGYITHFKFLYYGS